MCGGGLGGSRKEVVEMMLLVTRQVEVRSACVHGSTTITG